MQIGKLLKRASVYTVIILLTYSSFNMVFADENDLIDANDLYASSAVLYDAEGERVLYEKNGYEEMPMASTTKIMTCIIALEYGNLSQEAEVSSYAASMPDVQLGIREGEQYVLNDLLYALMLESDNDAAVAIAENVAGSVEKFADMMNAKAKQLGAYNTNFVTPNGLDADGHYTTSKDLARIASYAIKNEQFLEIINTKAYSFSSIDVTRSFNVTNKNAFLNLMQGAIGIKTGFTGKAGYCFVGALENDNKTFVSVVLASGWPPNKSYKWKDTMKLMSFGIDNFEYKTICQGKTYIDEIMVENGVNDKVSLYYNDELELLIGNSESITLCNIYPAKVNAPVKKGEVLGSVLVNIEDNTYCSFPIKAEESVEKISYAYCIEKMFLAFLP
ncbi:MAG: D-alanyl-D-alanine carboxypeptidase family protein [Eubacterium sp.]